MPTNVEVLEILLTNIVPTVNRDVLAEHVADNLKVTTFPGSLGFKDKNKTEWINYLAEGIKYWDDTKVSENCLCCDPSFRISSFEFSKMTTNEIIAAENKVVAHVRPRFPLENVLIKWHIDHFDWKIEGWKRRQCRRYISVDF
jgi:hypothetical protein